jgi:hypothetical protein
MPLLTPKIDSEKYCNVTEEVKEQLAKLRVKKHVLVIDLPSCHPRVFVANLGKMGATRILVKIASWPQQMIPCADALWPERSSIPDNESDS